MSAQPHKCPHCGGQIKRQSDRFCAYCGTALPQRASAVPTADERNRVRFSALREHPRFARLMQYVPFNPASVSRRLRDSGGGSGSIVGVVFFAMMFFVFLSARGRHGPFDGRGMPWPLIVPLIFVFLFVHIMRGSRKTRRRRSSGEARGFTRVPVRVAQDRSHVDVSPRGHGGQTDYFVTLETEDGERQEYSSDPDLAGVMARDDMGVAYFLGGRLVDFQRVHV